MHGLDSKSIDPAGNRTKLTEERRTSQFRGTVESAELGRAVSTAAAEAALQSYVRRRRG